MGRATDDTRERTIEDGAPSIAADGESGETWLSEGNNISSCVQQHSTVVSNIVGLRVSIRLLPMLASRGKSPSGSHRTPRELVVEAIYTSHKCGDYKTGWYS